MKGLFIKDIYILKSQQVFLIILIVLSINAVLSDPTFVVGYSMMMFVITSTSTISYDKYNHGETFLFAMPITRREYVYEKYSFSLGAILLSLVITFALSQAYLMINPGTLELTDILVTMAGSLPVALLVLALLLPIQLIFEAEKVRIITIGIAGGAFAVVFLGSKLLKGPLSRNAESIRNYVNTHTAFLIAVFLVLLVVFLLISLKISLSVMEKKEF